MSFPTIWIPAFAGMTGWKSGMAAQKNDGADIGNDSAEK